VRNVSNLSLDVYSAIPMREFSLLNCFIATPFIGMSLVPALTNVISHLPFIYKHHPCRDFVQCCVYQDIVPDVGYPHIAEET
jgi:hypothetical protein